MSTTPEPADTSTTLAARDHARAMGSITVDTMPTLPASAAAVVPPGVDASSIVWAETLAGGASTSKVISRGTRLRFDDLEGDACVALLIHNADQSAERLNIADTVKVQWQAYPTTGSVLLSDLGRVMMAITEDSSGCHDAFCGTSNRLGNAAKYGDGEVEGDAPNGRDRFAVALVKHGLSRRDIAPNLNLFKGVTIGADGAIELDEVPGVAGTHIELRAEMNLIVTVVNVAHVLDRRPTYTVTPVRITAWSGEPAVLDDAIRCSTPEVQRSYLNTESLYGAATHLLEVLS